MRFHLTLAAGCVAALLTASHASAQRATYCDKSLAADSVYSTVSSNGKSARVDYFVQLRNTTSKTVQANLQFNYYSAQGAFSDRLRKTETLPQYKSVTLKLGSLTVNNPGGQGAVSPQDVLPALTVVCAR